MSSPAVSLQNSGLAAQTTATVAIVSVPDVPPELAEMPVGTVLPAVMIPAGTGTEMPVMRLTLPDGKELDVPVKSGHPVRVPTPVSIRILPLNLKKETTVRVHFSAPLPDVKKAMKDIPEKLRVEKPASAEHGRALSVKAFVLHSVPEQIAALMNASEDVDERLFPALKPEQTVKLELSPRQAFSQNVPEKQTPSVLPAERPPQTELPEKTAGFSAPAEQTADMKGNAFPPVSSGNETAPSNIPLPEKVPADGTAVSDTVPEQKETPTTPSPESENTPSADKRLLPEHQEQAGTSPSLPERQSSTVRPVSLPLSERGSLSASDPEKSFAVPEESGKATDLIAEQGERPFSRTAPSAETGTPARPILKGVICEIPERSAPLVATKAGVLALEEPIRLPPMTPVDVKIVEITETSVPFFAAPEENGSFQSLTEVLETLSRTDPAAFESIKNILPQIGSKLPAQIFSYIQATSHPPPLTVLIGETNVAAIRNIGEKGQRLLNQIEKEISSFPKKATDGRSSWKSWAVPFLSGAVVEPVSLYVQKAHENDERRRGAANKPDAARFVLDLNLTRLGKLQMDGLAHRAERRFDLILRHDKALPDSFDDKVRFLFTQTLTALNYTGTVDIKHTDQFIVLDEEKQEIDKRGIWA